MEKEPQPESIATVTIKPEYPPSEVYSSEPPPAYHRSQSSSVQVAKIIAVTVVLVSVVLGGFILASAYVTANASCRHLEQELELLSEAADRFQPSQPEALTQEEPIRHTIKAEPLVSEQPKNVKEMESNSVSQEDSSDSDDSSEEDNKDRIHFKLPLQLDFDDLAGALIEKNQRSRMNCIVEKKRAEEVVDHQPKTVRLPFGVNLTTDPRFEHLSGERMAIFCESGNVQRAQPQPEEDEEDTIMIQPVMIPIPQGNFATHMAMMHPQAQAQQPHPMETMRPPVPPMVQNQGNMPPNPIIQNIIQQIIAQKIMESQRAREQQQQEQDQSEEVPQRLIPVEGNMRLPIPEEVLTQLNRLPHRDVIVAVSEQDPEEDSQEVRVMQEPRTGAQGMNGRQTYARGLPVDIPVPMMQQDQEQEPQAASEEPRPHYVQPRSIRSVDSVLGAKRVKRCSCDCAC